MLDRYVRMSYLLTTSTYKENTMNEYQPMTKEEVRIVEYHRGAVQINGSSLQQSPFKSLDANEYPNT